MLVKVNNLSFILEFILQILPNFLQMAHCGHWFIFYFFFFYYLLQLKFVSTERLKIGLWLLINSDAPLVFVLLGQLAKVLVGKETLPLG